MDKALQQALAALDGEAACVCLDDYKLRDRVDPHCNHELKEYVDTIRAHIDSLSAERDEAFRAMRNAQDQCMKFQQAAVALTTRCEKAEADARRYRWIEANAHVDARRWVYWHDDPDCVPLTTRVNAAIAATRQLDTPK